MFSPIAHRLRSNFKQFLDGPIAPVRPRPIRIPDDLIVADNGAVYDPATGNLDYLWFELTERLTTGDQHYFKAVQLAMLTVLPRQDHEQSTILLEMQKALKAVNTAQIDLVCLSANILDPDIGVMQRLLRDD